jgi:hypothetical protein
MEMFWSIEESSTFNLGVVFCVSQKSSNGVSPNDILLIGKKQQDNLLDIVQRFRFARIVNVS